MYSLFLLPLFLQGNDESFLHKLTAHHVKSSCLFKSKSRSRASFGVVHFAGIIEYDVTGEAIEKSFISLANSEMFAASALA